MQSSSIFVFPKNDYPFPFLSFYNTKAVFLAVGITAVVCVIVTVFCFQTKVLCVFAVCSFFLTVESIFELLIKLFSS